jgi:hypothetical protein
VAQAIQERFDDLDYLHDIGELDLNISGCMNACGHHHVGHIGILGVDKNGEEWYQIRSAATRAHAPAPPRQGARPVVRARDVPTCREADPVLPRARDSEAERFIDVVQRIGIEPFKNASMATLIKERRVVTDSPLSSSDRCCASSRPTSRRRSRTARAVRARRGQLPQVRRRPRLFHRPLLRERYGYRGELRAVGTSRATCCSISRAAASTPSSCARARPAGGARRFEDFSEAYQASVARPLPLFRRRRMNLEQNAAPHRVQFSPWRWRAACRPRTW